jgi:cytochrome c5
MARTPWSVTLVTLALAVLFVAGCSAAIQQGTMTPAGTVTGGAMGTAAPTATLTQQQQLVFGQNLFNLGCVCHPSGQLGAPSVSQVASLPASTIQQTVRQGRGQMPMWNQQQLSQDWLSLITNFIESTQQGTPTASQ